MFTSTDAAEFAYRALCALQEDGHISDDVIMELEYAAMVSCSTR